MSEAPRFAPGDRVRTSTVDPDHHTRLPRYARGHVGEVVRDLGAWPLADEGAQGCRTRARSRCTPSGSPPATCGAAATTG
jgi:hypothetical protein